jgi:hypothetical protein
LKDLTVEVSINGTGLILKPEMVARQEFKVSISVNLLRQVTIQLLLQFPMKIHAEMNRFTTEIFQLLR